ncbi:MAG: indolepyruvate oxidoreductase subunit beta [Firmicutes bacterium ADurb.Bin193]|nr:MAG: indolepyruvate oxidoreductase subunit beta [Firmicutes bacterium ADurb.Bin193]
MNYNILIAGVGGQGTILASRILALCAISQGAFARTGETIGMSQRGGCVASHVRMGSADFAAYIPPGCADLLLSFELCEAARSLPFLRPEGACIVNTDIIKPVTVSLGSQEYDSERIIGYIKQNNKNPLFIDAYSLAQEAGSVKAVNVVLLGAALGAGVVPLEKEALTAAVLCNVPEKFAELNLKAFDMGFDYAKRAAGKVMV